MTRTTRLRSLTVLLAAHALVACSSSDSATDPWGDGKSSGQGGGSSGGQGGQGGASLSNGGHSGTAGATQEDCATPIDDDGDGQANEGCGCAENATQKCYVGDLDLAGIGACAYGTQTCVKEPGQGEFDKFVWGPCEGSGKPGAEVCGNGVDEDCSGNDEVCKTPQEELALCDSRTKVTGEFDVVFPEVKGKCVWDHGEKSGSMAGHFFELKSIDIPAEWVPCGMQITSPGSSMYYDDFMLVHFDNRALIGSTGIIDLLDVDADGLPLFDWAKMLFKKPVGNTTCLPGATVCKMPGTQQDGPFALTLDAPTNKKLMTVALTEKKFEFGVVTTGDNNPGIDCSHSKLTLHVVVEYYVK